MSGSMDWDDLRYFMAAAEAGSLSGAARRLRVSVATVGRRLDRLEESLGVRLFHRHAAGLHLSEEGAELLEEAGEVAQAVSGLRRRAQRLEGGPRPRVVVSTLEVIATHVLAPTLGEFRARHPDIELVLRAEGRMVRLAERGADIVLRVARPTEERAVCQRLATLRYGLYAAPSYLERRGRPACPERSLEGHDVVTYLERWGRLPEVSWLTERLEGHEPVVRVSSTMAISLAVHGGAGLGILPEFMASDQLERLVEPEQLPQRDLWVAMHEDLRQWPPARAVVEHLHRVTEEVLRAQGLERAQRKPSS